MTRGNWFFQVHRAKLRPRRKRSQVVQSPLDGFRHWRSSWEMGTLRLETVLISNVREGNGCAIRSCVLELSLHCYGCFLTNSFYSSSFFCCYSVACFVTPLVAAVWVYFRVLFYYGNFFLDGKRCWDDYQEKELKRINK